MNNHYLYLLINIGCIIVPFIASFYPKHPFFKEWKYFLPANLIIAFLFLIWDHFFTKMGVWGFNPDYLTGIYISNLPLEEVLFFIAIPYASVFTYFAIKYLIRNNPLSDIHRKISFVLFIFLIITGIIFYDRWYTFVNLTLSGIIILITYLKKKDMSYIYLGFLFVIPFFLLSNGILTGTFLEAPIVWYNNAENLGYRILTIPVEDTFYGFSLITLNIILYEYFKRLY
ncbi:MAG: lycopene cyclase domain-containing protein [Deltaproteobacteria bacterium]